MEEYFELAKETLLSGEAFITTIKRPNNLPGRHAVVFTGFCDSLFQGLDPDCRLNRSVEHSYSAVKGSVVLDLGQAEFIRKVSGENGFVPLLGVLSDCDPSEVTLKTRQDIFNASREALDFYKSVTGILDFRRAPSMPVIHKVLKPVLSDLRTAVEIRDEYWNKVSETALFLKKFESEILEFRRLIKNGETIPQELHRGLKTSLACSCDFLEEHLSSEGCRKAFNL